MDKFTPSQRSKCMSAVKSRDTKPEIFVRSFLHRNGFRFRVCDKKVFGHPDIVLPRYKTLIEIRGCFWHRHNCAKATTPATNLEFWQKKFDANVKRDKEHERIWAEQGWNVIVVWECELKTAADRDEKMKEVVSQIKAPKRNAHREFLTLEEELELLEKRIEWTLTADEMLGVSPRHEGDVKELEYEQILTLVNRGNGYITKEQLKNAVVQKVAGRFAQLPPRERYRLLKGKPGYENLADPDGPWGDQWNPDFFYK